MSKSTHVHYQKLETGLYTRKNIVLDTPIRNF